MVRNRRRPSACVHHWWTSALLAEPPSAELVEMVGSASYALQQPKRGIITRTRPDRRIKPRHRLQIVVVDVRPSLDDRLHRRLRLVAEIRGQYLDRGRRSGSAKRLDHLDELARAAVGKIVPVDDGTILLGLGSWPAALRHARAPAGHRRAFRLDVQMLSARACVAQDHHLACLLVQHSPILRQPTSSQQQVAMFSAESALCPRRPRRSGLDPTSRACAAGLDDWGRFAHVGGYLLVGLVIPAY